VVARGVAAPAVTMSVAEGKAVQVAQGCFVASAAHPRRPGPTRFGSHPCKGGGHPAGATVVDRQQKQRKGIMVLSLSKYKGKVLEKRENTSNGIVTTGQCFETHFYKNNVKNGKTVKRNV
jgi:hypothetical protein